MLTNPDPNLVREMLDRHSYTPNFIHPDVARAMSDFYYNYFWGVIVVHQVYNKCTTPLHKGWAPQCVGCCIYIVHLAYNYHYSYFFPDAELTLPTRKRQFFFFFVFFKKWNEVKQNLLSLSPSLQAFMNMLFLLSSKESFICLKFLGYWVIWFGIV
jgi:hypothetical protein